MVESTTGKSISKRGNDWVLLGDIQKMIGEARAHVASAVNAGQTWFYWRIGKRINEAVLKGERVEYGKEILATLSQELVKEYDSGFSFPRLYRKKGLS